jgi:uncharacterized protein
MVFLNATSASHTVTVASKIQVRPIHFRFPDTIERYWLGDSAYNTHLLNSLTLLLPDIERYINQTIKQQLPQITDPTLRQQARAFIAQEAQHASQHTRFWNNLRQQGYQFEKFVSAAQRIWFQALTPHLSLALNLAIVAGLEHLTSLMAEIALIEHFLDPAEPNLKALFEWHAAEEIEHQAVAFDVLQSATRNYGLRLLGLVISNLLVLGLMNWGTMLLLHQDKKWGDRRVWLDLIRFWFIKEKLFFKALASACHYAKPNFHPTEKNNQYLVAQVFEQLPRA